MNRFLIAIVAACLAAGTATAGSRAQECLALGYQTENADLVAVGSLAGVLDDGLGTLRATFALTETIRGDATVGTTVVVAFPDTGRRSPWEEGRSHLLFLVRRGAGGDYTTVAGASSVRAIPDEGVISRLPEMTRKFATTLPTAERPADPAALRALLITWMQDPEPGVAWSGATDFVRRRDLHSRLTGGQRAAVLTAFIGHPFGKASKDALAMAVAAARPKGAGEALVEVLASGQGRTIRGTIADALSVLCDPAVPGRIAEKLETADAPVRADLIQVLGAFGGSESVDVTRKYVTDPSAEVRVEAAHALGSIARKVREAMPDAKVAGLTDLEGLLAAGESPGERQAALWALAQLQDPEAVALLTKLARDDDRASVRKWAARYRARPRLSLILP